MNTYRGFHNAGRLNTAEHAFRSAAEAGNKALATTAAHTLQSLREEVLSALLIQHGSVSSKLINTFHNLTEIERRVLDTMLEEGDDA